jgi:lysophospholipase L1-like esterase
VRGDTRDIERFGLHGVFVETARRNAWAEVSTTSSGDVGRAASVFELFYYRQPRGGDLQVFLDGTPLERIRTRDAAAGPGYARYEVPDGPHSLRVRATGNGLVRLFGMALERERPGVIVDTLGINGARARYHLMWEDQLYREHLRRRNPDLVVLAYGTNESGDDQPIALYEAQLRQVVSRVRETVPNASCLLVGPSDRPARLEDGSYEDRPRTAQLIQAQHRVAVEMGCGFFDLVAFMGGPLSMVAWNSAEPAYGSPDHVHFTRVGTSGSATCCWTRCSRASTRPAARRTPARRRCRRSPRAKSPLSRPSHLSGEPAFAFSASLSRPGTPGMTGRESSSVSQKVISMTCVSSKSDHSSCWRAAWCDCVSAGKRSPASPRPAPA